MSEIKHTPTPWLFVPWHIEEGPSAVRAPDGWLICETSSDANAEIIALAVNSHAPLIEERDRLREALQKAQACLEGEPTYHHQGMGCGLEDRNITDRYDAMEHGWECAMERVYGEHINGARDVIEAALSQATEGREP